MSKVCNVKEAVAKVENGASIMIGGFLCCGQPFAVIDALIAKDVGELTIICNDGGVPGQGVAKLVEQGRVRHLITSHIGLNPIAGKKMHAGEMRVDLVPQGTLAEQIRAKGAGLGGILTPTGLGTKVGEGKKILQVAGADYLVETALGADFSFVYADISDSYGNSFISKSYKNFNIIMAMAADHTIMETRKIVEVGELDTDSIHVPSIFIKALVEVTHGG